MATFFKCILTCFQARGWLSGTGCGVSFPWGVTFWTALAVCPLSPVYTGVCSVEGWGAGHTLILLMLPHSSSDGGSAQGVRRKTLVAWLSEGDEGKRNSIFSRLWFISQRLLFTFRYLLWLGKACMWTSYQFVHPSNSVCWVLGLES